MERKKVMKKQKKRWREKTGFLLASDSRSLKLVKMRASSPVTFRKITIRLKTLFMDKDTDSLTTKTERLVIVKGIICIRKKEGETDLCRSKLAPELVPRQRAATKP
jgi:hypothetical protein